MPPTIATRRTTTDTALPDTNQRPPPITSERTSVLELAPEVVAVIRHHPDSQPPITLEAPVEALGELAM